MNEVSLTLKTFMQLCKLLLDTNAEKERLRKIVVMQNHALEKLVGSRQNNWVKLYKEWERTSTADLAMRDKIDSEFWPPLGMIP